MKAYFHTLGCKVNQYETQEMSENLSVNGIFRADSPENADIIVVNSCTVTQESTRKTKQAVRRLKKLNPNAVLVLTGCLPQAFPEEADALHEADVIIGNKNNADLLSAVNRFFETGARVNSIIMHEVKKGDEYKGSGISSLDEHTRAYLKIQDGCNRFCSYCIIPTARGRSRSKPLNEIEDELKRLAGNGYKEIVFVGINLSAYGREIDLSLADAVETAERQGGIERIRLGSLEPDHITDELLGRLKKCGKLCPHFHLSLQSGSNSVLKRMNRHYTAEEYLSIMEAVRKEFPDAAFTTDVIAGFPGESDEEFVETCEFIKKAGFQKVHIFPFSARKGTRAYDMDGQIEKQLKIKRCGILNEICTEIRNNYLKENIGKTAEVLFEAAENGKVSGYTKSYLPVEVETTANLQGQIKTARITSVGNDCCIGELI